MSVIPSQALRFEASTLELHRLRDAHGTSTRVRIGLEALTDMLLDRMRPTAGRTATLGPKDVATLEQAARDRGPEVEDAFKALLSKALGGTVEVGGQSVPLLLLDEVAREQLANFAGRSSVTDQSVRGGLSATAESEGPRVKTRATDTLLQTEAWRMLGLDGKARGGKKEPKPSEVGLVSAGLRSVSAETIEALAPRINEAVATVGVALLKDEKVIASLGKLAADPKTALPLLCKDAGATLSTVLGCSLVNEDVVRRGLQLLPSVGRKLGIDGIEKCAANIGKVLLKEGAEEAVKAGAKQGVKKGVMGLLSTIPLANAIPMLFTGAEMLHEFTQRPPDKRVLGKGLATFALQLGALAFPPLGLAATAVDLSGSVAIAVADGQKKGLSKSERQAKAQDAITERDDRTLEMAAAIDSNAGVVSQTLDMIERSFRDLGSDERADRARELSARARELRETPGDEEQAKELHRDLGRFSFDTLLPEMIDQVRHLEKRDPEDANHWSLMAEALGQIGASVVGVRSDPERNEPKLKMLIGAILKAGIAGGAIAKETTYPAKAADAA